MLDEKRGKIVAWDKLAEKEVGDYKIFRTYCCKFKNLKKAQIGDFFLIKCNNWVQVIAETDDGKFVMVRQFRFGSEQLSLELPGGVMDEGETAIEAAKRELAEETGYCGDRAQVLATLYPNPAIQTNVINVVLINGCKKEKETKFDEFEDLETYIMSKSEVVKAIEDGTISHCIPIAALAKYFKLK